MKNILMLIILSFVITGCSSTKPIINLQNEPIYTQEITEKLSSKDIERAIIQAGSNLGWDGKLIEPGLVEATFARGNYDAIVDISYTEQNFNITYKDSHNLKYNDGKIHKNYNRWVANLSKNIKEQVQFYATLTGEEVFIKTAKGLSFWRVDNDRKASAMKVLASGKGINNVVLMAGNHTLGGLVSGQQINIGTVDYKAKHEYLVDYLIEDKMIYYWVKDLTDNVVVYGKERSAK
jgi:hypothetical protein